MKVTTKEIENCLEIEMELYEDERGHFQVSYNEDTFYKYTGYKPKFIQDNESYSKFGTVRGIHFQTKSFAQSKLVRCVFGVVKDVIVDLRPKSKTYGKWISVTLDKPNKLFYIPKGCGHGFSVLSDFAIFQYKVDAPYNKISEGGIIYNDPTLNIDWGLKESDIVVSKKDLELPNF